MIIKHLQQELPRSILHKGPSQILIFKVCFGDGESPCFALPRYIIWATATAEIKESCLPLSAGTAQQREPRVRVIYEVAVEAADWEGCSIIAVSPQMCFQWQTDRLIANLLV